VKVAIGGLWHETNTFSSKRTTLGDFEAYQFVHGTEILPRYRNVRNEIGGFIQAAADFGLELIPTLYAGAVPSGIVAAEAWNHLRKILLEDLQRALPVDGVLLALHGAMVAEGVEDVEGTLLKSVRGLVGANSPIVVTLDSHANISPLMYEMANLLIGYDTYPHIDPYDRGFEAGKLICQLTAGDILPTREFRKLPLLTPPQAQLTSQSPMRDIMAEVQRIEEDPKVLAVTVAAGFPYCDVERVGLSIVVQTNNDQGLAKAYADTLCSEVWKRRDNFAVLDTSPVEAVRRAMAFANGPVILVDVADNIGGGAAGDGTALLEALVSMQAMDAVVVISDPESVDKAIRCGVCSTDAFQVGGKLDDKHGPTIEIEGYVRLISDGAFSHRGSYMTGQHTSMGRTTVLNCNGLELVLTEKRVMPFDAEHLRSLAIEPARKKIIVVKSAIAWQAAFGELAREVIYVDTPGICSSHLRSFDFHRIPRPIVPLDHFEDVPSLATTP